MKYLKKTASLLVLVVVILTIQHCGEDGVNAPQDFMAGTITFADSNLNFSGGYYAVSFFADSSNPFTRVPVRSDSLAISTSGGVTSSYYKSIGLPSGHYYIGCTWINRSTGNVQSIYGSLGCNTNPLCSTPTRIEYPNYAGTAGLNFSSRTN